MYMSVNVSVGRLHSITFPAKSPWPPYLVGELDLGHLGEELFLFQAW